MAVTVYDCTMFLNENDLYEIRLNSHWNFVDKFIVIEAGETHTGLKKPFNFDLERFKPYAEKLVYVKFDSFEEEMAKHPELLDNITMMERGAHQTSIDWSRDHFQHSYMVKVLNDLGAEDTDIVYFSCCDEILKEKTFLECLPIFENKDQQYQARTYWAGGNPNTPFIPMRPILYFNMYLYSYKFNLLHKHWTEHICATLTEVGNLRKILPSTIRDQFIITHPVIPDAGWHFTFLDPTDGELVLQKMRSWAHSKDLRPGETSFFEVTTKEEAVERFFKGYNPKIVEITPETHPPYIVQNLDKLQNFVYNSQRNL